MTGKGLGLTPELRDYLLAHSIPRTEVHRDLVAATREAVGDMALMQIAEEQGPLLTMLARLVGARRAVEVGTFTGLSALCIVEGMADDGVLTCFDVSEEYVAVGRPFWERAGVVDRIEVVIGPAAETLAEFDPGGPVDLAFVDADKGGYLTYHELLVPLLAPGGLVVYDNVLWFGNVLDEAATDEDTLAIRALNDRVAADERVEAVMLNVGDGLLVARKR